MRNVSDESCRENQNTHFMFYNFFSEYRGAYEKMRKKYILYSRTGCIIIYCMAACCTPKPTNAHPVYVTLTAFPLQQ